ncbi:unnamed protein product [Psylliodes chrysocephalus]|uniref:N-acetyltransferase domain-containing protein n=1 Tax=Psylliodes chrysocephalus TaxID=3402493 RepID=A0A9P0D1V0_9CUCU|nr:unnamed protein product [Psylliodes chrysocephala]
MNQIHKNDLKFKRKPVYGPIIWRRLALGVRIQDLLPNNFEIVVDIILKYYIKGNVIFNNSRILDDPISVQSFTDRLYRVMKQCISLVAVDERTDEIIGCLLITRVKQEDYGTEYNTLEIGDGKVYRKITEFLNDVNRTVDIFANFDTNVYLKYCNICITDDYRNNKIGFNMLSASFDLARYLEMPVIMAIADSYMLQKILMKLGFKLLHESDYRNWNDATGELVFNETGSGNYTCSVLACSVPQAPDPEPVVIERRESTHLSKEKSLPKKKKETK